MNSDHHDEAGRFPEVSVTVGRSETYRKFFDALLPASKEFIRSRENLDTYPGPRTFIRHIDATINLYKVFAPSGSAGYLVNFIFNLYRMGLIVGARLRWH